MSIKAYTKMTRGLKHHGLVTPCGAIDLGQLNLWCWLAALRHQANTRTNVDFSNDEAQWYLTEGNFTEPVLEITQQ